MYNLIICEKDFDRARIIQTWNSSTDLRFNIDIKLFEIDYNGTTLYGIRVVDTSCLRHFRENSIKYYSDICINYLRVRESSDLIRNVTHYWNDNRDRDYVKIKLPKDVIISILKKDGINNFK